MTSPMLAAQALARHGWQVLPCTPGGKRPMTPRGHLDASADPRVIARWWTRWPAANVGVSCAASGLLVLDVDPRHEGTATMRRLVAELGELPRTVTAETGGGGWHLVYKLSAGELRGSLGPGVDLKHNGYIIVAPSIHPTGRRYRWISGQGPGEAEVAELPLQWLATVRREPMRPPEVPPRARELPAGSDGSPYGLAALRRECEALSHMAPETGRNNKLNCAAVSLARLAGGGEIDPELARAELLAAAGACGLVDDIGERRVRATLASGWRYGTSCLPRRAPERPAPRRRGPPPPGDRDCPPELRGGAP